MRFLDFIMVTGLAICGCWVLESSPAAAEMPETTPVTDQRSESKPDFESIFNGRNLDGWYVSPSPEDTAESDWYAEDGMIVGRWRKQRSYLVLQRAPIGDFDLQFEYRFPGKGNSGVSIRARPDPTGKRDYQSYHADLGHLGIGKGILGAWDFHTPGRHEHGCPRGSRLHIDASDRATYSEIENPVQPSDIRQHGWNAVRVRAVANRFEFYLNGKLSSAFEEHLAESRRLLAGSIQLQLHDPGMVVQFRNLELRILDADAP